MGSMLTEKSNLIGRRHLVIIGMLCVAMAAAPLAIADCLTDCTAACVAAGIDLIDAADFAKQAADALIELAEATCITENIIPDEQCREQADDQFAFVLQTFLDALDAIEAGVLACIAGCEFICAIG